jgi:hypothetical protein
MVKDKKALEAFARKAANSIKTHSALDDFREMLTRVTVETALNAELDEHLGYEKHSSTHNSNSRNSYSVRNAPNYATSRSNPSCKGLRPFLWCAGAARDKINAGIGD